MKFVFLYTEIAEYVLACCSQLAKHGEVHIIRWPVNKEAPFQFQADPKIKLYSKSDYALPQLHQLVNDLQPDVIVCSGWIDKDYLKICKSFFKKIPTVMTCDTHWTGSFKQRLATVISRFTLLNIFSHAWVPGTIQKTYVKNLGFKLRNIHTGFYSCDLDYFTSVYESQKEQKALHFPKRFLYVGRYYEFKGIKELWQAFIELQQETPNEWELWCLGVGDIEPVQHPKIKHFGFIQPKELSAYTEQTGIFILPSHFEPWGVVVHEFAASGFPLLLSRPVGAKAAFLKEGENGYEFEPGNPEDIKQKMKKMCTLSIEELLRMSHVSNSVSKTISPQSWTTTLLTIVKNGQGA